ncbi:MAG: WG repeat-containing protein [Crocinitomicaceae bacterium]
MRGLFVCILLLGIGYLFAQNALPFREGGKWGLINQNKSIIMSPRYDFIFNFKNLQFAVFMNQGKYGIVQQNGKELLPAEYTEIQILNQRFFACQSEGLYTIMDETKNVLAPRIFKKVAVIGKDLLLTENDTTKFLIQTNLGKVYRAADFHVEVLSNMVVLSKEDSCVVLNYNLEEIAFSGQRRFFYFEEKINFSTANSEYSISSDFSGKFRSLHEPFMNFNEDKSWYIVRENGQFGVFDPIQDQYILKAEYDWIEALNQTYFKVKKGSNYGVINVEGKWFLQPKYRSVFAFSNSFYVIDAAYHAGLISVSGNTIIPLQYDWISDRTDFYEVALNSKLGIYSLNGEQIEPPVYDEIRYVEGAFKCYAGPVKNSAGKIVKYKKVVSFDLDGSQVSGRVEFKDVGMINIRDIYSRTSNSAQALDMSIDSIYRWKKVPRKFVVRNLSIETKIWGFRDTTFSRFLIQPKYDKIEPFLDRNYTLAKVFSPTGDRSLRTPFGNLNYASDYDLVDHDNIQKLPKIRGFLSLSSVYQDQPLIEYFTGDKFVFVSTDSLKEISYSFIDKINQDQTRRVNFTGEYAVCSPHDLQMLSYSKSFISELNGAYNDSIPFGKKNSLYLHYGYKDVPIKIQGGKWNLVDETHFKLLDEDLDFIENPVRKKYLAVKNGKWGLISRKEINIPFQFFELKRMRNLEDSVLVSAQRQFQEFIIDSLGNRYEIPTGRTILKKEGEAVIFSENGKFGLLDEQLEILIPAEYGRLKHLDHNWFRYRKKGKMGLVHPNGNVIHPEYNGLTPLSENFVLFDYRKKQGLINQHGDTLLPPLYEKIELLDEQLLVLHNGKYELVDPKSGKSRKLNGEFKAKFNNYYLFQNESNLLIYGADWKVHKKITKFVYVENTDELIHLSSGDQSVFYNKNLEPIQYENKSVKLLAASYYEKEIDREKVIMKAGKDKTVDKGNIIKIAVYGDYLVYKANGKFRLFNTQNQQRYNFESHLAKVVSFHEDYFIVQYTDRKMAYVDLEARPIYNREFEECSPFNSGYAIVKEADETKIFFRDGRMIEGMVYHLIRPLIGGFFKAQLLKQYGLVSENKGVLVEAEYDRIQFSNGTIVQLVKDGDVFYYDFSREVFIK